MHGVRFNPAQDRVASRHDGGMKLVSYAGQQLVTTEAVAEALVTLAAAIASEGDSEAVRIPIVVDGEKDYAELIVGVGNDILVGPHASEEIDPDFTDDVAVLQQHRHFPRGTGEAASDDVEPSYQFDIELDRL